MSPVPVPPPWQARCGYIRRGGAGGWRSARAAVSLSNSPSSRGGCAPPAGENWVSSGPGAAVLPRLRARERGRASGLRECGAGRTRPEPPAVPGSHRSHLPLPSSPAAGAPRAALFFWECERAAEGRAEPVSGAQQQERGPAHPGPLPPPRPPSSRGGLSVPGVSRVSPFSAPGGAERHGRCIPTGIGVVFLPWHQLLGPERPLVRRPLSLQGDYLLAAALFSPGHGACVGCGSCAGKPQSPWSDRGMGPLPLPLPAPGLTPPAPGPARQLRPGRAGNGHGQRNRHGRLVPPCPVAAPRRRGCPAEPVEWRRCCRSCGSGCPTPWGLHPLGFIFFFFPFGMTSAVG